MLSIRDHSDELSVLVFRTATIDRLVINRNGHAKNVGTIFKGGTSLSRVFQLINRFSDDIDLLIVFPDECSKGAQDKVMKQIAKDVQAHLGLADEDCKLEGSTTGIMRYVRFHYAARQNQAGNSRGVKLEMGIRGGSQPAAKHDIRSLLANYAIEQLGEPESTWSEFAPVPVMVLAPERSLLEKLALFHSAAMDDNEGRTRKALAQSGRHLYDVHQLLRSSDVLSALRELERPSGGFATSTAFQQNFANREIMQTSYDIAGRELIYGAAPTFDECILVIQACAEYL